MDIYIHQSRIQFYFFGGLRSGKVRGVNYHARDERQFVVS